MFTLTVAQLLKRPFFLFFSLAVLFTHALTNHVHVFKTCGVVQVSLLFPILYVAFSSEVLICPFWCKKKTRKKKLISISCLIKNAYFLFALSYILSICLDHNQRVISLLMHHTSHTSLRLYVLITTVTYGYWCVQFKSVCVMLKLFLHYIFTHSAQCREKSGRDIGQRCPWTHVAHSRWQSPADMSVSLGTVGSSTHGAQWTRYLCSHMHLCESEWWLKKVWAGKWLFFSKLTGHSIRNTWSAACWCKYLISQSHGSRGCFLWTLWAL